MNINKSTLMIATAVIFFIIAYFKFTNGNYMMTLVLAGLGAFFIYSAIKFKQF